MPSGVELRNREAACRERLADYEKICITLHSGSTFCSIACFNFLKRLFRVKVAGS
jgi:hypothetical protein